jgi:hypothetical protein
MEIYSSSPESTVSRRGQTHVAKKEFEMMKCKKNRYFIKHSDSNRRNKKTRKHTICNKAVSTIPAGLKCETRNNCCNFN